jgi:[acyl-carrier-protein] S-malonyltransferase
MKGTFHAPHGGVTATGGALEPGATVGTVANLRDSVDVTAPHGGTVVEWLVEDADPVSPGQPLVRLHPSYEEDAL